MTSAIEARELVKTYPGEVRALDGLSFAVEAGTVFALLGPNGAGKSTTVKILTTLSRPDEGEAWVVGHDVLREPDSVRHAIGVVAQKSGVDREATGRENMTLEGQIYGLGGRELKQRVSALLERFGLAGAGDRLARTYSGGMQRRLDIAMGLVHRPQVLFLDEPTTGLDPEVRADMWQEIARLANEEGLTILLTTHYLEEADELASSLAIVDRGRIVARGTPDALKSEMRGDALHIELGEPEANGRVPGRSSLGRVRDVAVDGRSLHARADDGARAVPVVLQALETDGIQVVSATVARPSLEDVTCATPAALTAWPRRREADDHRTRALPLDDRSAPEGPLAAADLDRRDDRPARHLARPLRRPVQERRRDPRLRPDLLRRLPDAWRRRDDGPLSAGWLGMSIIQDLDLGIMDRFLVSPVRRGALIAGRIAYQSITTVIQSLIIVGIGAAIGAGTPEASAGSSS